MKSYTTIISDISATLQDSTVTGQASSNAKFPTAFLDILVMDALREISQYEGVAHVVSEPFTIESRFGTASSVSSGRLVDAGKSQFVSGDVGKVVYNETHPAWAVITTYNSSSNVTLSADIFTTADSYKIFNAGCTNERQVNISGVTDRVKVLDVQYPVGCRRNFKEIGDILEFEKWTVPDSAQTVEATRVLVNFAKRHKVSQLTDFAGAVNNAPGYAAGVTSMAVNNLQSAGTMEADQEFTIAGLGQTYRTTAAATISGNAVTISFAPALEGAVANGAVITFTQSTLTPRLETVVTELTAGVALQKRAPAAVGGLSSGGARTPDLYISTGARMEARARAWLNRQGLRQVSDYARG